MNEGNVRTHPEFRDFAEVVHGVGGWVVEVMTSSSPWSFLTLVASTWKASMRNRQLLSLGQE